MAKVALLVGVSRYESGLAPLPSAIRDVEALHQVLGQPEIGAFDQVTVLKNPERHVMEEAIDQLFSDRYRDDLVLFFFSGHGIKDDKGKLHLAACNTRKTPRGELFRSTAVAASSVHDLVGNSLSRRRVVILDCCFSGAFADDMSAKDDGSVDVRAQLGGEGRAILTSSTSTQYSFEDKQAQLSVYTRYLVEGLKGEADENKDGFVSVGELHKYASTRVRQNQSGMKPESYISRDGFDIQLTKVPLDIRQEYSKAVKQYIDRGEVSEVGRWKLDGHRISLGLSTTEAAELEAEILEPYRQEFKAKLQRYEETFAKATQREETLSNRTRISLQQLQQELGLDLEDTSPIELRVTTRFGLQRQKLQRYERALIEATRLEYPLNVAAKTQLQQLRQQLELTEGDISSIQIRIKAEAEAYWLRRQQYEQMLTSLTKGRYPLNDTQQQDLQQQQQDLGLIDDDVAPILSRTNKQIDAYQKRLQRYEQAWVEATQCKQFPKKFLRDRLQRLAQSLSLDQKDVAAIDTLITTQIETYQQKLRQYEQELKEVLAQQYPLTSDQLLHLQQYQQQLKLSVEEIVPIKTRLIAKYEEHQQKRLEYAQRLEQMLLDLSKQSGTTYISPATRIKLQNLQRRMHLDDTSAIQVEEAVISRWELATPQSSRVSVRTEHKLPGTALLKTAIVRLSTFLEAHQQRVQKVAGISVLATGLIGCWLFWNQHVEQTDKATLAQIVTLDSVHKYDECISQAQSLPTSFRFLRDAQAYLNTCRFNKAQDLAEKSKFQDAIALVSQIPNDAINYASAQTDLNQWSESLIKLATKKYQLGDKDEAISMLQVIPSGSTNGKKAQQEIARWQTEWVMNEKSLKAAQSALDKDYLQTAMAEVQKVTTPSASQRKVKEAIVKKVKAKQPMPNPPDPTPTPSIVEPSPAPQPLSPNKPAPSEPVLPQPTPDPLPQSF